VVNLLLCSNSTVRIKNAEITNEGSFKCVIEQIIKEWSEEVRGILEEIKSNGEVKEKWSGF